MTFDDMTFWHATATRAGKKLRLVAVVTRGDSGPDDAPGAPPREAVVAVVERDGCRVVASGGWSPDDPDGVCLVAQALARWCAQTSAALTGMRRGGVWP